MQLVACPKYLRGLQVGPNWARTPCALSALHRGKNEATMPLCFHLNHVSAKHWGPIRWRCSHCSAAVYIDSGQLFLVLGWTCYCLQNWLNSHSTFSQRCSMELRSGDCEALCDFVHFSPGSSHQKQARCAHQRNGLGQQQDSCMVTWYWGAQCATRLLQQFSPKFSYYHLIIPSGALQWSVVPPWWACVNDRQQLLLTSSLRFHMLFHRDCILW